MYKIILLQVNYELIFTLIKCEVIRSVIKSVT